MMEIRQLEPPDRAAIERFVERIPEGIARSSRRTWRTPRPSTGGWTPARRAWSPSTATPSSGTSQSCRCRLVSHVGEVRVIVDPDRRGKGIGRALARHAVREALRLGLSKMVVEVVADQESTIALFRSHGFDPEALLATTSAIGPASSAT